MRGYFRTVISRFVPLAAVLAVLLAFPGCTTDQQPAPAPPATPAPVEHHIGRYVALGDSYTAAPYVGVTALENGCLRSEHNYPALLAERLRVSTLVDVSCAGAQTRHLREPQHPFAGDTEIAPQLDAVNRDTDLVTLGIGGNDLGLFRRLLGRNDLGTTIDVAADITTIGRHVGEAVRLIRAKAPDATVVVVGYPRLAGAAACPRRLPVSEELVGTVDRMTRLLRDRMAAAAHRNGALFADLYKASKGHDVCSRTPWVNGMKSQPMRAMALHPLAAGQDAAATLLAGMLDR